MRPKKDSGGEKIGMWKERSNRKDLRDAVRRRRRVFALTVSLRAAAANRDGW
jgi:hypothetical protein